ncbi:MAG: hypothetical protein HFJ17_06060 [Clostridia bacterium]|nr:hypothetical protein [Clostridia bacterium]
MKYLRKNDAITLIALVITIIVLLILAGVAINILAGDNGILKQAAKAKGETENATIEEQAKLKDMEDLINENTEEDDYDYDAWYGDGTQTEYYIKKAIELCKLSEIVNSGKEDFDGKTIYLMSDINMNDAYNAGYTFNIIGNSDYDFRGRNGYDVPALLSVRAVCKLGRRRTRTGRCLFQFPDVRNV